MFDIFSVLNCLYNGNLCVETVTSDSASWQSTTTPTKPMTHDKLYYFLPYWDNKPCMHIRSVWSDYRRRMYNSNIIDKIAEKFVRGNIYRKCLCYIS